MEQLPSTTEAAASSVDDLASALSSSILETSLQPGANETVEQLPSTTEAAASGVDDIASALSSSILETSIPPAAAKKASENIQPSSINDLGDTLSYSILQSCLEASTSEKVTKSSLPEPGISKQAVPSLTLNTDVVAKSIIADVLQSSTSPPVPQVSPSQTLGQSSDAVSSSSGEAAFGPLADQLTTSIISDALSLAPPLATPPDASPPLNRPAIFIQVERRGSGGTAESPRSSRSSSLTGQTITLHEYTDELVESSCREGVAIALFQAQGEEVGSSQVPLAEEETSNGKEVDETASSSVDKFLDGLVSSSIQNSLQQTAIEVTPDEGEMQPTSLASDAPSSLASTPRVVKQSPNLARQVLNLAGRKRPSLSSELSDTQSDDMSSDMPPSSQFQPKLLLAMPSSRMSYAWSTASTRDEDSRPVSPTNLDRIALDLTQNIEEFSNLLSKIIVSEVISTLTGKLGPQSKMKSDVSPADESESDDQEMDLINLPTSAKIDAFLSRLDQASPLSEVEETDEGAAPEGGSGGEVIGAPYPNAWHQMRATLLRPVATGNWGCGAFKGNPQLKSMIQWAATSAAGRPQMIYCSFENKEVKQV